MKPKRINDPEINRTAAATFADKQKAQGLVKMSVSAWVPKNRVEEYRATVKRAIARLDKKQ